MTALVKTKHEEVLGFDPATTIKDVFKIMMTPYMAQYILDHLNNNNRKIVEGQIAAIRRSAAEVGWLWDGGACYGGGRSGGQSRGRGSGLHERER